MTLANKDIDGTPCGEVSNSWGWKSYVKNVPPPAGVV